MEKFAWGRRLEENQSAPDLLPFTRLRRIGSLQRLRQHCPYEQQHDRLDAHGMELQRRREPKRSASATKLRSQHVGGTPHCMLGSANRRGTENRRRKRCSVYDQRISRDFIGIEIGTFARCRRILYLAYSGPERQRLGEILKLMDRGDLVQDPQFATAPARKQHRSDLYELIRSWIATKTRQELWDGLRAIDYFGAPVLSMGEVIEDPHIKERKAFIERNHPTAGPTTLLAPWIHMSKTSASIRSDSPALGQHTDEVLGGYSAWRGGRATWAQGIVIALIGFRKPRGTRSRSAIP